MTSFEYEIRPLFSEGDRAEMWYAFDLWSRGDVAENAELILGRIEDGSMPCDGPWPEERVQLFRDWVAGGCAP